MTQRQLRALLKKTARTFIRHWLKRGDAHDVHAELEETIDEAYDAEVRHS